MLCFHAKRLVEMFYQLTPLGQVRELVLRLQYYVFPLICRPLQQVCVGLPPFPALFVRGLLDLMGTH